MSVHAGTNVGYFPILTIIYKAKQKNSVLRLPRAFVGVCLIQQNCKFLFSFLLFFSQKYTIKDMTYTVKHIGQQTFWTQCSDLY